MKRKALLLLTGFLLLSLLCSLLLSGCGSESEESSGNALTVPLDHIIGAVSAANAAEYESAFPADFCEAYRAEYPDLDETVEELLLAGKTHDESVYGVDASIRYELLSFSELPLSALESRILFQGLDEFLYDMPLETVKAAKEIEVRVTREGSFSEKNAELSFVVLQIGDEWLLHPSSFGTLLN